MSILAFLVLLTFLLVFWQVMQPIGCFALVVGRDASADGSVLVGHNEENQGERILDFRRVPRWRFGPGQTVRLRRGGELPQVDETCAYFWSENVGLEFSDTYFNEWGVAIVSNSCPTREDECEQLAVRREIRDGGIGYLLRRLAAERATTAREAVELVGRLVERFGYVHSGRTYVIADPGEAWLVGIVRGRRWVAQRVPDDAVVVLPNVHIIDELPAGNRTDFLSSPDLLDYATGRAWYDPAQGEPFSFRKAYSRENLLGPNPRRWWGQQLVTGGRDPVQPPGPLPLAVRPAQKLTVADVAAVLRDRSGPVPLFRPQLQESAVFQLRRGLPREIGCIFWRTTGRPDVSPFTPWYLGVREVPTFYHRPVELAAALALRHHFEPPAGTFDPDPRLAWWKFHAVQQCVDRAYDARIQAVRSTWSALESRLFREQAAVESAASARWLSDPDAACDDLTRYCAQTAEEACREADRLGKAICCPGHAA